MGDDLLDLPVLKRVGLAAAPADAVPKSGARPLGQRRTPAGAARCASSSSWCCGPASGGTALVAMAERH